MRAAFLRSTGYDGIRGKPQKTIEYITIFEMSQRVEQTLLLRMVFSFNSTQQSVRAKITLGNKGVSEREVIIERAFSISWVVVCASNLNYETWAGSQATGWVLGSDGNCYHSGIKQANIVHYL
ncbi:hypothetical protein RclHR1_03050015 [Rhizophagus clarus]|uniref:Uncharacterized protein n=1 Tax=Rhizophagus clarus TaxID=94130 RepID=A0A2Z6S069_9GLOM|nr:hypothetical protein RclHR1_03050015 [Rhizophagus clarus]